MIRISPMWQSLVLQDVDGHNIRKTPETCQLSSARHNPASPDHLTRQDSDLLDHDAAKTL